MGDVLIFAEHQFGHFPKTTLTAIHSDVSQIIEDLLKKKQSVPKLHIETLNNMVFQQHLD